MLAMIACIVINGLGQSFTMYRQEMALDQSGRVFRVDMNIKIVGPYYDSGELVSAPVHLWIFCITCEIVKGFVMRSSYVVKVSLVFKRCTYMRLMY